MLDETVKRQRTFNAPYKKPLRFIELFGFALFFSTSVAEKEALVDETQRLFFFLPAITSFQFLGASIVFAAALFQKMIPLLCPRKLIHIKAVYHQSSIWACA